MPLPWLPGLLGLYLVWEGAVGGCRVCSKNSSRQIAHLGGLAG